MQAKIIAGVIESNPRISYSLGSLNALARFFSWFSNYYGSLLRMVLSLYWLIGRPAYSSISRPPCIREHFLAYTFVWAPIAVAEIPEANRQRFGIINSDLVTHYSISFLRASALFGSEDLYDFLCIIYELSSAHYIFILERRK